MIIDKSQVRSNADVFLERDVRSLCKSFRKQGVKAEVMKVLREVRDIKFSRLAYRE